MGAEVIGISEDTHETNCAFAESLTLDYPLVGDAGGAIARSYDVLWPFIKVAKRMTFVIDAAGKLRFVFSHEVAIGKHVDDVLKALRKLSPKAS